MVLIKGLDKHQAEILVDILKWLCNSFARRDGPTHPPGFLEGLLDMLWNDLAFEQKDVKRGNYAWR